MTLKYFAKRFSVTHPNVIKWEKCVNRSTSMSWAIEKDIRLMILKALNVKPRVFVEHYERFEEAPSKVSSPPPVKLDIEELS